MATGSGLRKLELHVELSPKETAVAALVSQGFTTKQIASSLSVSPRRVRVLVSAIAYKANLDAAKDERVQVALWWTARNGIPIGNTA